MSKGLKIPSLVKTVQVFTRPFSFILRQFQQNFGWKNAGLILSSWVFCFFLLNSAYPLPKGKEFSQVILANDGSLVTAYLTEDEKWRMRTRPEEVPPELITALVNKEDQWFWYHPGVNPFAIVRAGFSNLFSGRRVSGASTITMQVARMLEPKPRTFGNKLFEMFRALQLELSYSKSEILEMYLSYLPMGGNVEGVKAASFLYFDQPPTNLSLGQSALLTVIPNRPNSLRPDKKPKEATKARDKWLRRFMEEDVFPATQVADALHEPLFPKRHAIPNSAPQFAYRTKHFQGGEFIHTTIDPEIQRQSQSLLQRHVRKHQNIGLHNGAVLIVENATMEVKAYCASADFFDRAAKGQVDAIKAKRSPGSTLKPLIYAQAFDKGDIHPSSMLLDVPTEYPDFRPVNYDRSYRGQVRLEEALQTSLNIPAVRTLNKIGLNQFLETLSQAGFKNIANDPHRFGLSVALGGCEASLEELVTLYASFAHQGQLRNIKFLNQLPVENHSSVVPGMEWSGGYGQICSPEAAWMVTDILSGIRRPDLPNELLERTDLPRIAWKTGTSFGRRDAWAIGYNPEYTIGVWFGNMEGTPVLSMSGSTVSVPLLVDLFTEVHRLDPDYVKQDQKWFEKPERIETRQFCSETGDHPGPFCNHYIQGLAIKGVTRRNVCDHLQEVLVNRDTTVQYCTGCAPRNQLQKVCFPALPPDLSNWYLQEGMPYRRPPRHNPACQAVFSGHGPEIASLKDGEKYYLEKAQSISVRTSSHEDIYQVFWYVNGKFAGTSLAGQNFVIDPPRGRVTVSCMDDKGRTDKKTVKVLDLDEAPYVTISWPS